MSPYAPRESVCQTQERPQSKMAAGGHFGNTTICYPKKILLKNTTRVSILTNFMVKNPFQGLFGQILPIFTLKSKMAAIILVIKRFC